MTWMRKASSPSVIGEGVAMLCSSGREAASLRTVSDADYDVAESLIGLPRSPGHDANIVASG